MEKKFASSVPEKVERNGSIRVLNYGVREATEAEILEAWKGASMSEQDDVPTDDFVSRHKYVYYSVSVPMAQWKYDGVVNAIIREKYRADEMEAITNNMNVVVSQFFAELVSEGIIKATAHLVETMKEVSQDTFKEMQEWRALAKKEAKEVFNVK